MTDEIDWGELGEAWWTEAGANCHATRQQIIFALHRHQGMTQTGAAKAAQYAGDAATLRQAGHRAAHSIAVCGLLSSKVGSAEPATDSNISAENVPTDQSLDQQIADLLGPDPGVSQLEGELNSVRQQELDRQSRSDFEGFSSKLQAELGPNVPDDYARTQLLAMASEKPELQVAWQYRHLTAEQRRAADLEFQQLEALYWKAQQAPDDPRKAQALAQMERRGQELGLMMNAQKILNSAWRDVQKRAEKVKPPISEEATQIHMDVAAAVRGASAPVNMKEPPPELGKMDDQTFRRWKLENLGWE